MVAKADVEKSKPSAGNKVSKPLMEKKRRARINKCLDQLKSLLESHYSSSIRKRKLEKADILELTVNHLRNLQKLHSCTAAAFEFSDYRRGFRRCLANVDQYLLTADNLNGGDRRMLSQLSAQLCSSGVREAACSTTDSGQGGAETRDESRRLPTSAAGPEENEGPQPGAPKPNGASASPSSQGEGAIRQPSGSKQLAARLQGESSGPKKCPPVRHRDVVANIQRHVWRPW